jgi:hypothetical protein
VYAGMSRLLARAEAGIMLLTRAVGFLKYQSFLRLFHTPRPDDVFIVSYPKAGTTVMQMMLHNIVGDGSMDFEHIDTVVPWFEVKFLSDVTYYDGLPSPRVFKTHFTFAKLPRNALYIYLLRNPKDTCVSYYFHIMSAARRRLPLGLFVARFLRGHAGEPSWFKHLEACCRPRHRERVLLVNYDDFANALGDVVDQVSAFFGYKLDEQKRIKVIERCSFGFMKRHSEKFDPRNASGGSVIEKTDFIRKGMPGDWVNHLTPALASVIDQRFEEMSRDLQPHLSDQHARILTPPASGRRGTLRVWIGPAQPHRLLVEFGGEIVPWGIRMAANGQPLQVGDRIRLELILGESVRIVAEMAEVVFIAGGVMDLRLAGMEAMAVTQLRKFCFAADRSLFLCAEREICEASSTYGGTRQAGR